MRIRGQATFFPVVNETIIMANTKVTSSNKMIYMIVGIVFSTVLLWFSCVIVIPLALTIPWEVWISSSPLSPIHRAAENGDVTSIKRELDSGVSVDLPTLNVAHIADGTTPLMLAYNHGQDEVVELLIEKGANIMARDSGGGTALHYPIYRNFDATLLLLKAGAAIDDQSTNGLTPLMITAMYGPLSQVEVLLAAGADLHLTDNEGNSALDWAKQYDRPKVIELLESALLDDVSEDSTDE